MKTELLCFFFLFEKLSANFMDGVVQRDVKMKSEIEVQSVTPNVVDRAQEIYAYLFQAIHTSELCGLTANQVTPLMFFKKDEKAKVQLITNARVKCTSSAQTIEAGFKVSHEKMEVLILGVLILNLIKFDFHKLYSGFTTFSVTIFKENSPGLTIAQLAAIAALWNGFVTQGANSNPATAKAIQVNPSQKPTAYTFKFYSSMNFLKVPVTGGGMPAGSMLYYLITNNSMDFFITTDAVMAEFEKTNLNWETAEIFLLLEPAFLSAPAGEAFQESIKTRPITFSLKKAFSKTDKIEFRGSLDTTKGTFTLETIPATEQKRVLADKNIQEFVEKIFRRYTGVYSEYGCVQTKAGLITCNFKNNLM